MNQFNYDDISKFREDDIVSSDYYPRFYIDKLQSLLCTFANGKIAILNRADLLKYIELHQHLRQNDEIVTKLWDRVQVAMKNIGSPNT